MSDPRRGPQLHLTVLEPRSGRVVVAVSGELDMAGVPEFEGLVRERLVEGPVHLDLSALEFMDSSGVRALDTLLREPGAQAGRLVVDPRLQAPVRQILEVTGLIHVMPFGAGEHGKRA